MKITKPIRIEQVARALTVLTFVMMCWVAHRSLEPRLDCLNSSFISFVQMGESRVGNCVFESRFGWTKTLRPEIRRNLRALEVLEPLRALLPVQAPTLAVDLHVDEPDLFELGRGYVRIGQRWLDDPTQLRRALVMGVLRARHPSTYGNQFQLEVVTDFLLLSVLGEDRWLDEAGESHSLVREQKFSTVATSFERYCQSPFRSLSHVGMCALNEPDSLDAQVDVWGLRPLLAVSYWRVFERLPLREKLRVFEGIREGRARPPVARLRSASADAVTEWAKSALADELESSLGARPTAGGHDAVSEAYRATLAELEIETPTRWELTMDLTHTPVWREIFEQLRQRSHLIKQRMLIFTPEGARALPGDLPVAWSADEVQSQKHVMIACTWPQPDEAVNIRARHLYARQTCGKLQEAFWD